MVGAVGRCVGGGVLGVLAKTREYRIGLLTSINVFTSCGGLGLFPISWRIEEVGRRGEEWRCHAS